MVKDAYYFLAPLIVLAALAAYFNTATLAVLLAVPAAFVAFFFRDPERSIPADPAAVVSPADGRIIRLEQIQGGTRLSIFLSVFDVHVNRAPIAGAILRQEYRPGRFVAAFDERASAQNEQLVVTIDGERQLTFALIAGLIARRIVAWKKEGDHVAKGDRIGLIRFGSRVDVFLPSGCEPLVKKGDRVRGGTSVIGLWREER